MREENRYLFKWSKVMLIIIIPFLIFGLWEAAHFGSTSIALFICLSLVVAMFFTPFLENRIFNKLEKVLGIRLKRNNGYGLRSYTYEGLSWNFLMYLSILALAIFYPSVVGYHNFPFFVGWLFLTIYPLVVMIIRRNTFSDNSIPSAKTPVYVGPNLVSGGPGYNPLYYLLFSLAIGGASTVWGFSMLNFSDIPLEEGLSMVFIGLVGQTLILFPDKFNRISPADTRTRKGLYFMIGVTIAIIICIEILSGLF